jgi:TonB family protein
MKTMLNTTAKISAILFASAVISTSINAQSSNSLPKAKFVSFTTESKSSIAYDKLNEITKAIEDKIKFRAPLVNDSEKAISTSDALPFPANFISDDDKDKSKKSVSEIKEDASNSFRKWVVSNLEFQLESTNEKVSGTVIVSFIVNTKGKVSHVKVITPSNTNVDELVVDLIQNAPRKVMRRMVTMPEKEKFILPVSYNVTM